MSEVWIAFSGKADARFLKMLRPGFRHCFALLRAQPHWLVVDSLLHKLEVNATATPAGFDLPQYMRARGYRVIKAPRITVPKRMACPSPFTCVEAMKRLIGLHDWRVLTPWQLYRTLIAMTQTQGDGHGKLHFQNQAA